MKRLLFIFNPHSGTGKIRERLAEVLDIFTKAGYEVVAYPTQATGDGMKKVLAEGNGFDRIVVAGGDGMLNELINGVMQLEKEVTVGYIPTGTVNDFARSHNIPKNIMEAAKIAASDNVKAMDVGKFGDTYFAYVAAFGVATNVSYDTKQKAKNHWGFLAYLANFLKCLGPNRLKRACRRIRVRADGNTFSGEFALGLISNSHSVGSVPSLVDKEVVLDDGRLECLFIARPKNLKEWMQLRRNLQSHDFSTSELTFVRAEKIEIFMRKPAAWTLDGENGGEHSHVLISAKQRALKIALPEEK